MISIDTSAQSARSARARLATNHLQTTYNDGYNQRFSWQDTPLESQEPTFQQISSPTNTTIDESPISPRDGHHTFYDHAPGSANTQYPVEKAHVERTSSPYNLQPPIGTHPAYFAPVADDFPQARIQPQHSSSSPRSVHVAPDNDVKPLSNDARPRDDNDSVVVRPDVNKASLVYNPNSLAGPNAAVENHRPGQVSHPNATIEPDWKHGLCEFDTLCCTGVFCPCIVYGKTQYRISRKTQKEDPTNMLGYESCNNSCGLMALACGFQCMSCSSFVQRCLLKHTSLQGS